MNNISSNSKSSIEAFDLQLPIQSLPLSLMNPLLGPETRIETYEDLMMNLDQSEKGQLEREMEALPENDKTINLELVTNAIHNPDLEDSIWEHSLFPLFALSALKEKKIDGMDFSTSQLFYNAMNHPKNKGHVKIIPLFINNSYNPQALALIEETLEPFVSQYHNEQEIPNDSPYADTYGLGRPLMSSAQIPVFLDMMARLRPLQRMFLLVPEPQPLSWKRNMELQETMNGSVSEGINTKTPNFNVFCRISDKLFKVPLRMIPSKGMLQAYIFAIGGNCTLISQFKFSSYDYLKRGILVNERGMCLNFAFLTQIDTADTIPCHLEANELEFHDFYHIVVMSFIIKQDRRKFYGFAILLERILEKEPTLKDLIHSLYESVVEMEAIPYQKLISLQEEDVELPREPLFWTSLNVYIKYLWECKSDPTDIPRVYQLIISELVNNADEYQKDFELNVEFLEDFETHMLNLMYPLEETDFDCIQDLARCYRKYLKINE